MIIPIVLGISVLLAIVTTEALITEDMSMGGITIGFILGFIVYVLSIKKFTNINIINIDDDRTKPWDYIRRALIVLFAAIPVGGYVAPLCFAFFL